MNDLQEFLTAKAAELEVTGATAGVLLARKPLVVRDGADGRRHIDELK